MDTQKNLPAWRRHFCLFWKLRIWANANYEDRWNVPVLAKSCLAHHRGDHTKALRFIGHAIKVNREADQIEEMHICQAIREYIKVRPFSICGAEVLQQESPALKPGGVGATPASAAN